MAVKASAQVSIVDVSDGQTGATGKGISSTSPEYYLSSSKTTQTGGSWSTTPPTWSSGKYLWVRQIVTYTDSSVSRTQPYCDTSWEAVKEVQVGGRNIATGTATLTIGTGGHSVGHWRKTGNGTVENIDISDSPVASINKGVRITSINVTSQIGICQEGVPLNSDDIYTVSCWVRSNSSFGVPCRLQSFYKSSTDNSGATKDIMITDSWKRISFVSIRSPQITGAYYGAYVVLRPTEVGNYIDVCGIKFEAGNKPTDWSPAPEDVNHSIDSIQVGGRNLLLNSSFHNDCNQWSPRILSNSGVDSVFTNLQYVTKYNKQCAHIHSQNLNERIIVAQRILDKVEPDTTYTFSGWVLTENIIAGTTDYFARLHIDGAYNDGNSLQYLMYGTDAAFTANAGKGTWEYLSYTFTTDKDKLSAAVSLSAYVYARDLTGDIYFCDLKLEKGNKATDWTPAPEDVNHAIDSIQVGGRNLLLNTGESSSIIGTNTADQCLAHHDLACGSITNLEAGEYTCSADIIGTVEGGTAHMQFYGPPWETIPEMSGNVTVKTTKQKIGGTFTLASPQSFSATGMRVRTDNVSGTITVSNMKLEKGNKATDWSPAPEDVEADATKKANEAAKTATNYMKIINYDGLMIGDMTADTLGKNVLIDNDSVDIRNGDTVLASYGDNVIYLGKNNRNATIDFCDGLGKIYNYIHNDKEHLAIESTDVYIDSSIYPHAAHISLNATKDGEKIVIGAERMDGSANVNGSIIEVRSNKIDIGTYNIFPAEPGGKVFNTRIYSEYGKGTTISGHVYIGKGGSGNLIGICQIVKMGSKPATIKYQSDRTKALIEFWKTSVGSGSSSPSYTVYDSAYITGLSNKMTAVPGTTIKSGPDFAFVYSISSSGEISVSGNFSKYRVTYFN